MRLWLWMLVCIWKTHTHTHTMYTNLHAFIHPWLTYVQFFTFTHKLHFTKIQLTVLKLLALNVASLFSVPRFPARLHNAFPYFIVSLSFQPLSFSWRQRERGKHQPRSLFFFFWCCLIISLFPTFPFYRHFSRPRYTSCFIPFAFTRVPNWLLSCGFLTLSFSEASVIFTHSWKMLLCEWQLESRMTFLCRKHSKIYIQSLLFFTALSLLLLPLWLLLLFSS